MLCCRDRGSRECLSDNVLEMAGVPCCGAVPLCTVLLCTRCVCVSSGAFHDHMCASDTPLRYSSGDARTG